MLGEKGNSIDSVGPRNSLAFCCCGSIFSRTICPIICAKTKELDDIQFGNFYIPLFLIFKCFLLKIEVLELDSKGVSNFI